MPAQLITQFSLLDSLEASLTSGAFLVVDATATALAARMRQRIQTGPKTGVVYTSGPPPLPHQASAPGESPASWTKMLEQSIRTSATGRSLRAEGEVAVGAFYGAPLEYGTVKMGARPFIHPSVQEIFPLFVSAMELLLTRVGGGSTFGFNAEAHFGVAQRLPAAP